MTADNESHDHKPAQFELHGLVAAALAGGFAALAYATGVAVLSLRYQGFGLPGQQLVGITPREQVLIRGAVALLIWAAIGMALFGIVELAFKGRQRCVSCSLAVGGLALVVSLLILTMHVFWPLFAILAVVTLSFAASRFRQHPTERLVVCAVAVAAVAISYEAGRLSYGIEWSTVALEQPPGEIRGVLIGQADRGVYIGQQLRPGSRLSTVFIPARRVSRLTTEPQTWLVNPSSQRARREPIRDRIWRFLTP